MTLRGTANWLGLALVVTGSTLGLLPLLPATPATGTMRGVPHLPWTSLGLAVAGIVLLLWGRGRDDANPQ